jgi:Holliday junction resolvase
MSILLATSYTWSQFGREAEITIAIYMKYRGWGVKLSQGSRGPADIIAAHKSIKWLIQVKSSTRIPKLKGYEVKRLIKMAKIAGGLAVVATLQPTETVMVPVEEHGTISPISIKESGIRIGNYMLYFYSLPEWKRISP